MALYTRESRDAVRDKVDFVELVGARTELRRAGPARYEGLCPFHDERTPSFGIDPAQKVMVVPDVRNQLFDPPTASFDAAFSSQG